MKITLADCAEPVVTRSALIPAGMSFNASTNGKRVGICFLDPCGGDLYQCKKFMGKSLGGIYFDSNDESHQIQVLENIFSKRMSEDIAYEEMKRYFFSRSNTPDKEHLVDDRIVHVIAFIKNNVAGNHSNRYLADLVDMSDIQLRRIFKKTTGIPIRRYRLWHRLFVTANLMALGNTLTEASIAAGFSDSSHFNHVFKSMLGIRPSFVLKRAENIRIFAPYINNCLIGDVLNFRSPSDVAL